MLDTGSNRTIVNINSIDVNNNINGKLIQIKQHILTANGQPVPILGIKQCILEINNFSCVLEILVVENLIQSCIVGMDFITKCPSTQILIQQLKTMIEENGDLVKLNQQEAKSILPNVSQKHVCTQTMNIQHYDAYTEHITKIQ